MASASNKAASVNSVKDRTTWLPPLNVEKIGSFRPEREAGRDEHHRGADPETIEPA